MVRENPNLSDSDDENSSHRMSSGTPSGISSNAISNTKKIIGRGRGRGRLNSQNLSGVSSGFSKGKSECSLISNASTGSDGSASQSNSGAHNISCLITSAETVIS